MRLLAPVLFAGCLGACATTQTSEATTVHTDNIDTDGTTLTAKITYEPKPYRTVELVLDMHVGQFDQTGRLSSSIFIKGFNVVDGSLRWSGFVAPRQAERHRVTLQADEEFETASAVLTLTGSAEGQVLLREELTFVVTESGGLELQP